MNATVLTPTPNPLTQLTYQVLIEKHDEDLYSAIVWELPECRSSGSTKEEALKILHRLLTERLKKVEIVSLTVQGKRISKSIDNRVLRHHHVEINNQREQSAYSYYP